MSHPVENIMRSTMEQLRQMVDVNTIVGSPVRGDCRGGHVPNAYGVRYKRKRAHAGIAGAV